MVEFTSPQPNHPMTNPHTAWHFVRCSDIETRQRLWVDPSTNCILNAVEVARYGRTSGPEGKTLSLAHPLTRDTVQEIADLLFG